MTDDNQTQAAPQSPEPNLKLKERLSTLVGVWCTEITMPLASSTIIRGQTSFDWLEEGSFVVERGRVEHSSFPTSVAIIGGDDSTETYSMLYFDSRGVSRIYEMSLSNEAWKLWREAPGFSQRFTGTFSDDGNTIAGFWEKSSDGSIWERDFDLIYRKGAAD